MVAVGLPEQEGEFSVREAPLWLRLLIQEGLKQRWATPRMPLAQESQLHVIFLLPLLP
jgi:hypothetical protein